jgi:hypothetical protein
MAFRFSEGVTLGIWRLEQQAATCYEVIAAINAQLMWEGNVIDVRESVEHAPPASKVVQPPNGSRLSCGRNGSWRKAVEPQTKRLAGEATQFFPTGERPSASSAC